MPPSQIFINLDTLFSTKFNNKVNRYQVKVNLDGNESKFLENEDWSPDFDFSSQHC